MYFGSEIVGWRLFMKNQRQIQENPKATKSMFKIYPLARKCLFWLQIVKLFVELPTFDCKICFFSLKIIPFYYPKTKFKHTLIIFIERALSILIPLPAICHFPSLMSNKMMVLILWKPWCPYAPGLMCRRWFRLSGITFADVGMTTNVKIYFSSLIILDTLDEYLPG